jgi:16S rRNA (uracil1498-N3)-methyltransferase
MPSSKPKIRLFVNAPYASGQLLALESGQSHYLAQVMRCREGEAIGIFNGQDGLWLADVSQISKKQVSLRLVSQIEPQRSSPDVWLAFAPIKNKSELVVEKAIELGVSKLLPVFTRHAVVRSINHDKLTAHAIEAAEQCERHDVPPISEHKDLAALLGAWPKDRPLLFADESGAGGDLKQVFGALSTNRCGVLIGPEGGFSLEERQMLLRTAFVHAFCMGPRILRADTAAVAALACVQAWLGDWNEKPHFEAVS